MDLILLMLFVIVLTQIAILATNLGSATSESNKIRKLFVTTSFTCDTLKEVEKEIEERLSGVVIDLEYDIEVSYNIDISKYEVLILTYTRRNENKAKSIQ